MHDSYEYFELNSLQEIVNDYQNNFHGKSIEIKTNFKSLNNIIINFDILDLPHILGLQYLSTKQSASNLIQMIKGSELSMRDIKKDNNFYKIKDRFKYYNFLNRVFFSEKRQVMVVTKDIKPPRLGKVEFLIYDYIDTNKRRIVLIGFAPTSKGYYVPATLHVRTAPNIFTTRRVTQIVEQSWIQ
ncbi:PBECR4 domain-containing protein [Leuconostoc lactis]|uniref:PBECR4 domain-containing protein n=1 Tax=Leuconostoc lactis TaxID=1246 RepID=UPI00020DA17D|nr:PBECR4 domain-containing protein [Leuconostoc lactis]